MRRLLFLLVTFALASGGVLAKTGTLDRTQSGDGVTITSTSPFSDLPPSGGMPYHVTIRNDTGAEGTWRLTSQTNAMGLGSGGYTFNKDLNVPVGATASFDLVLPLPVSSDFGSTSISITINGPGLTKGGTFYGVTAYSFSNHSRNSSPFAVIGNGVLGSSGTSLLEGAYTAARHEFYGTAADPQKLPTDWRAYAGVAVLLLQDTEWLALSPEQRDAISNYVVQGGHVLLYTQASPDTRAAELHLPTADGKPGDYGFGVISLRQTSLPIGPPELMEAIAGNPADAAANTDSNFGRWGMRKAMGTIAVSTPFILGFVLLFGGLVGPVNLFVFARGRNRFRLFWTTPLISVVASLALVISILATDGLGGRGRQFFVCYSMPGATKEAVIQEQIARTAVLVSTSWHDDQNYLITPISDRVLQTALEIGGHHLYVSPFVAQNASEAYHLESGDYSGNWFRSRNVSGQYLQAVRPSRAVLTVLNPAGAAPGSAPVVLSSFPQELDRIFLLDAAYHYWTCEHLAPGSKKTCVPATGSDFNVFWNTACAEAGGKLQPILSRVRDHPGCFYATGATPEADRLHTLDEVHWKLEQGIYLGPYVTSNAPESTP